MEEADDNDDNEMLKISDELADLNSLDVHVIGEKAVELDTSFLLNDVEILA
jgi:hypothetical protein